jgi:hypothetical protein
MPYGSFVEHIFWSEGTVGRSYSNFINSKKNQSQEKKRKITKKGKKKQGEELQP